MGDSEHVVIYPAPAGIVGSAACNVRVNGQPVFVYEITVHDGKAPMVCFDFAGTVMVEVETPQPVQMAEIRPSSLGIVPAIQGNIVRFTLSQPKNIVVEFNGQRKGALHLFANPPEIDPPRPESAKVRYFGPGVHEAGMIRLESDQTVYLAGGAYVYGAILGEGVHGAEVRGRGILNGRKAGKVNLVNLVGCRDIEFRDVILLDCQCWVFHIQQQSREVRIDNVRIINHYRGGTDGIDINSSQDVEITGCFIRDCDDNIVTKSFLEGAAGNVRHVRATGCVLWSDGCRALQNGLETRAETIEDVVFKDIDIIHHLDITHPVLSICCGDRAMIRDIHFEDIRIEDAAGSPLIDLWVGKSYYTLDKQHGHVKNVTIKNVSLTGGPAPRVVTSWGPHADERLLGIYGWSDEHAVEDVTIENLHVFGRFAAKAEDANVQIRNFTKNIRFAPPVDGSPVASFVTDPACPPLAGQAVLFDASSSFAQGGNVVAYEFDFGDGATATRQAAEHTYVSPGRYPVQMTVRDDAGRTGHARTMLRVFAVHEPNSPVSVRPGLVYWCYEGQFTLARDLSTLTPIQSGHLADLDQSLPVPGDHAVLVEGYLDVPASGVYTFFLDGAISRLYLAGQPVVEADFLMATWTNWGQIGLHKGKHAFSLSCDAGALQRLKVEWDGPGLPVQAIPVSKLYC